MCKKSDPQKHFVTLYYSIFQSVKLANFTELTKQQISWLKIFAVVSVLMLFY